MAIGPDLIGIFDLADPGAGLDAVAEAVVGVALQAALRVDCGVLAGERPYARP